MAKYSLVKYGTWKYGATVPVRFTMPRNLKDIDTYPICRIEILNENENTIGEIDEQDIVDGSTTFTNQFGQRRNASITLVNDRGIYLPGYRNKLWLHNKIRILNGWVENGIEKLTSRGIYVINDITASNDSSSNISVDLILTDKMCMLDGTIGGSLEDNYIIPFDTPLHEAVRQVVSDSGEIKNPIIDCENVLTYFTITKTSGDTYLDLLTDLASMVSADVFFDKNGYLHFQTRAVSDLTNASNHPTVYQFNEEDVNFISASHKYDFSSVKNYIIGISSNVKNETIKAIAQDNSLFSVYRVDLIGKRTLTVDNTNAYTQELLQTYVDWVLYKNVIMNESVELTCIPIDIIEEGNIITIRDDKTGVSHSRYQVNSINFPLMNSGECTMSCWKIREIL